MGDIFLNPITFSFKLLNNYKRLLIKSLKSSDISNGDIDRILKDIEVEKGVFFSLNREYEKGQDSFYKFCQKHGLSKEIPGMFANIPGVLYHHQEEAIEHIIKGKTTIISTGTGSGKTESFLIPIIDYCLKNNQKGIKAIIIYPMNALANDQIERIAKSTEKNNITFGLYTSQTPHKKSAENIDPLSKNHLVTRQDMQQSPPDILLTNHVMLDRMLIRPKDRQMFIKSRETTKYIVLDEIHIYRGNKATHLKYLLDRLKYIFSSSITQIGCSATLKPPNGKEGILKSNNLRNFIKPLLNVSDYKTVKPKYVEDILSNNSKESINQFKHDSLTGWQLKVGNKKGIQNLNNLTGLNFADSDLLPSENNNKIYKQLSRNKFVIEFKNELKEKGALSFTDLNKIIAKIIPDKNIKYEPEKILKSYLSAISFVNHNFGENPILDFRIHLFLRDIGGSLKCCIKCQRYHSGEKEICDNCGFPLFHVYNNDIEKCIGKISDGKLKYNLLKESDDPPNVHYVLISKAENDGSENEIGNLKFRQQLKVVEDYIILDYDKYGKLKLELLEDVNHNNIVDQTIPLIDGNKEYQYLHNIVKSILDINHGKQKKLLGFIDNREKASRYTSVLRDEFISKYFREIIKLNYNSSLKINLKDNWELLNNKIDEYSNTDNELLSQAIKEMELWYTRFISKPSRKYQEAEDIVRIKNIEKYNDFERELLNIFLQERAIDKSFINPDPDSDYIIFQKYWATDKRSICYESSQTEQQMSSITLSNNPNSVYYEFVDNYGIEKVKDAIGNLIEKSIIIKEEIEGKEHFYLNAKQLYLNIQESQYKNIREINEEYFLISALHSAEVKGKKRQQIEKYFQDTKINFLLATPTLELGIDIGTLKNILMVGAPPMPSNYAQRAGRAGRGNAGDHYALIITFCNQNNNHDVYYFNNPKEMINGLITPPYFKPVNEDIIKKHINAFIIAKYGLNKNKYSVLAKNQQFLDHISDDLNNIFGDVFGEIEDYFSNEFSKKWQMYEVQSRQAGNYNLNRFYDVGFLPDFTFRKDKVRVYDKNTIDKDKINEIGSYNKDYKSISKRIPEQAYKKFAPGRTIFMAGKVYKILPEGDKDIIEDEHKNPVHSFKYLLAEEVKKYASKDRIFDKYILREEFSNYNSFQKIKGVVEKSYQDSLNIYFYNMGRSIFKDEKTFKKDDNEFILGYKVQRESLIFRFNQLICNDQQIYSFCSVYFAN